MSKKQPLTQEQYDSIVAEIYELDYDLIPKNSDAIKAAKEQGDLSENAEYDDAKEEQAKLNHRLNELRAIKGNSYIIQKNSHTEFVEVGHLITLERGLDKEKLVVTLLGQWDGTKNSTSIESALGTNLLGKKEGDIVVIEAPIGEIPYKILKIE